jgi:T5SS/PEP-CTERM-associated repeat protein
MEWSKILGPSSLNVMLGDQPGSSGSLFLYDSVLPSVGYVNVGWHGEARLDLVSQELTAGTLAIGQYADSVGRATILDARLEVAGSLTVGQKGNGELYIAVNSTMHSLAAEVASTAGSQGDVMLVLDRLDEDDVDSGSKWKIDNHLHVGGSAAGPGGRGQVYLGESATLDVGGNVVVHKDGKLTLDGAVGEPTWLTLPRVNASKIELRGGNPSTKTAGGTLSGTGWIKGPGLASPVEVVNGGTIDIRSAERVLTPLFSSGKVKANLVIGGLDIEGSYTQRANGTLLVEASAEEKLVPGGMHSTGIYVNGKATLDGVLRVTREDDFVPEIGDRFAVLTAKSIEGKFAKFENPIIDGCDDRFWGVNYRRTGANDGTPFSVVEVITLETPRRLLPDGSYNRLTDGERRNLVFVTHGTASNANEGGWVEGLARSIQANISPNAGKWDVVTFDWQDFAAGPEDPFNRSIVPPDFGPWESANNAINIGESLARWMDSKGIKYQNAHVLGHSSGSWLADSLADELSVPGPVGPGTNVHLTMLDAFSPPFGIFKQGDAIAPVLGDKAAFAEQYYDATPMINKITAWTQERLQNAVNVNVTAMGVAILRDPLASHQWPYQWYTQTANKPEDRINAPGGFGFALSGEYSGVMPAHSWLLPRNGNVGLAPGSWNTVLVLSQPLGDWSEIPMVFTGDVIVNQYGADLTTDSPAMLTALLDLDMKPDLLYFDFEFGNGSNGLLSVFFDGKEILEIESSFLGGASGLLSSGWIPLEDTLAGSHSLLFRLDPLGDTQATLHIENIAFGTIIAVPEPSTWAALASMVMTGAVWMLRRRVSANRCGLGCSEFGGSNSQFRRIRGHDTYLAV